MELSTDGARFPSVMVVHKQQKEQFVSGLNGGSLDEIAWILSVNVAVYLVWNCVVASDIGASWTLDFIINCGVILASITVWAGHTPKLLASVLLPAILLLVISVLGKKLKLAKSSKPAKQPTKAVKEILPKKLFITNYRSHMLIITNLAILAVDFHVFPRRFAKVETWGTSLMDLGVGAFVFLMGLVSTRALIKNYKVTNGYVKLVLRAVVKSLPLLALGVARLISVKLLEYQEHVTEYGVHWNFFFTLGFLPIVLAVLDPVFHYVPRFMVAFAISLGYEYLLHVTDLLKFILDPTNRYTNLITMNKEGMWLFWGYFAIFLFGQLFGQFVMTGLPTKNNLWFVSNQPAKPSWTSVSTTKGLVIAAGFYGVIFWFAHTLPLFSPVSRRLANFPYVMWIVSFSALVLLGYAVVYDMGATAASPVVEATNNNGLFAFLLGNVITGVVNMLVDTLACSNVQAVAVLVGYSAVIAAILVAMDKKGIYIKL